MKKFFIIFYTFLIIGSIFSQVKLRKVTFLPHWLPQAQFAGYYVALEKGFYQKNGIDLTILTGGPKNPVTQNFKEKKVDFGLMWCTNALQLRDMDVKVFNIGQMINKSALMLVAKKKKGIVKIEEMNDKKVGIWGGDFSIQPLAFFEKYNIKINPVIQGSSINLFLYDGVDLTSAMLYNEYHTILNSGYDPEDLTTFRFSDYGLNFPEDGIYCSEDMLKNNPDVCRAFLEATLHGWKYAFDNMDEALKIVKVYMTKAFIAHNWSHQKWMLEKMKDLQFPDNNFSGFSKLSEEDYNNVAKILKDKKLIKNVDEFNSFYKPLMKEIVR